MSNYPFIIFEGVEGSGKTTQIKNVIRYLKKKRIGYVNIREPGGTKNSEKIRKLILNNKSSLNKTTDLFLYFASRSENVDKIISKFYGKKVILVDRFIYSTIAYQHFGMGINKKLIENINTLLIGKYKPDHIFLHTVSKKNLVYRLRLRKNKNRYDKFKLNFYNLVQKGYLKILKSKKNVTIIDSSDTLNNNKIQIIEKIKHILR